jgi:beta-galactosidase
MTSSHHLRIERSLNGPWRLALDPNDAGVKERWFAEAPGDSIEVTVPSVWDLWVPDYDGVGWYFRSFDLDEAWAGRYVALEFQAADYFAEVWVNGVRAGEHEGGYTPFALDVSEAVRPGENHVAVRIVDPHGKGYGPFVPGEFASAKEEGYFTFGGLWGGVALVGKPRLHISDVFVQPDIRRHRIGVTVETTAEATVRLQVLGTSYEMTGTSGALLLEMAEFEQWSPEHPHLYTLRTELMHDGEVVDAVDTRFGMREFTAKDNRFFLNNHPYFIKAVLYQPDYARTLAAPESVELARREILLAKEAGFNMLRLHIKPAPPITLELADELGMLLYEEPAIGWIAKSRYMKDRCEREVSEMIRRDRNHPAIVIWGMLNETGNAKYVTHGGAQTIKDDLCRLARSLDPSRLIIDDSGGVNATREPARMMRPYHDALEPYDDLHIYQRAPVDREIELYLANNGHPNQLFFLSEFGFGGMEDLADVLSEYGGGRTGLKDAQFLDAMLSAAQQGFAERNLDRLFGGFSGFTAATRELQCDAARYQIDALRGNPKIAGYCYTQLADAGHEFCAGFLDRWRRPKPVFDTLKTVQRELRPLIIAERTNLAPRDTVGITVLMANDARLETRADLSLQVVGPTNQVLWKKKRGTKIPRGGKELWSGTVSASGSPGAHRFVVRLLQGISCVAESAIDLHVFAPAVPSEIAINVVDPQKEWATRCLALAKRGKAQAPIHIVPPVANTIRAYPQAELAAVMAQVRGGAVAIFFGPPDDWNDFAGELDTPVTATPKDAVGAFLGVYHYAKLHPVFDGLPAGGLMRQPYRNVVAPLTFLESSDEDICGAFDAAPIAAGHYMTGQTTWWGSDILVSRYGSGRLVFTHLRILEHLGADPVADRLFVNMLQHFARRSVPSEVTEALHQPSLEWLRREQVESVRRWMVLGMFPNWDNKGHQTAYPPETEIDFTARYQGWYKEIGWRPWYTRAQDEHLLDLQQATSPVYQYYPRFDHGTGYAFTEIVCEKRQTLTAFLATSDAAKIWVNGTLVFETTERAPHDDLVKAAFDVFLKQGKNAVLVKISKVPGPFKFSLNFDTENKWPLKWWR